MCEERVYVTIDVCPTKADKIEEFLASTSDDRQCTLGLRDGAMDLKFVADGRTLCSIHGAETKFRGETDMIISKGDQCPMLGQYGLDYVGIGAANFVDK